VKDFKEFLFHQAGNITGRRRDLFYVRHNRAKKLEGIRKKKPELRLSFSSKVPAKRLY
jgi:hypothetical protein